MVEYSPFFIKFAPIDTEHPNDNNLIFLTNQ